MNNFFYGVIEGFYGRQWSWQQRLDYAAFLAEYHFDAYIYAPKGQPLLRSQWRTPLDEGTVGNLRALAVQYRNFKLRWGIGLSPLGVFQRFDAEDRRLLVRKISQINGLAPDILCILFDDVRGDIPALGQRQLEVIECILEHSQASQHIVCPTYYSFDPVLEQVFGAMPEGYLQALGRALPEQVGLCWTGNRVISEVFAQEDIARATDLLGRKPILWDNYPVNDGRKTSNYLHLRPYKGRPRGLREWTSGHLVNPMNQPWLSRLVLQSLPMLYRSETYTTDGAWQRALSLLRDDALAKQLDSDLRCFSEQGLLSLSSELRDRLIECYSSFNHPVAKEVEDWLSGAYVFDPACLTD